MSKVFLAVLHSSILTMQAMAFALWLKNGISVLELVLFITIIVLMVFVLSANLYSIWLSSQIRNTG